MTKNRKKMITTAALAALAMLSAPMLASAAPANIDDDTPTFLNIHKFELDPDTPGVNNGTLVDPLPAGLNALEGVEFTITPVTHKVVAGINESINLTDSEGWELISDLVVSDILESTGDLSEEYVYGTPIVRETSETGDIREALPKGLYLVQETAPGDNNIAEQVTPYLVTLPYPGTTEGTWLYDVHTYPKNALLTGSKTAVETDAVALGDDIYWSIQTVIPNLSTGASLSNLRVVDVLDSKLEYVDATVYVNDVQVSEFVVDYEPATNTVTVDLASTPAHQTHYSGLQGAAVEVRIATTVKETGVIENEATIYNHNGTLTVGDDTSWGGARVFKYTDTDQPLADAEFAIYLTEADAIADTNRIAVETEEGSVSTWVSGDDGYANIDGLLAGDYWVAEIKAPAGYVLNGTPFQITVVGGDDISEANSYDFDNAPVDGPGLPTFGSTGMIVFTSVGLLIIAIGLGAFAVARKKLS